MRIAVTGKTGQVARALAERAGPGETVILLGRPELDLAAPASIAPAFAAAKPDVVISAAAYTAVDKAESEADLAFAINAGGAGAVADAATAMRVPLIHISTDYVFDGRKTAPYREDDPTAPLGVYGRSKQAGEAAVLTACPGAIIARTAWVYSPFGTNFVKTMLRLAATRDEIGVVADQFGTPTSAFDLADALLALARRRVADGAAPTGLVHMAASGGGTWADLAEAIFAASAAHGGPVARARRITTAEYPTAAPRPANSRLDTTRLERDYGIRLPDWRASVGPTVERILTEGIP